MKLLARLGRLSSVKAVQPQNAPLANESGKVPPFVNVTVVKAVQFWKALDAIALTPLLESLVTVVGITTVVRFAS